MKIVVFGGAGFLGSHVADVLADTGYDVTIFDIRNSMYLCKGQKMIIGNILNSNEVEDAVSGAAYVYDFAGLANLDSAATRPVDTVMLNVVGTCTVLDACVKYHVKRFVYASSFYANSGKGGFYRCSKQSAEIYIEEYARKYGINYTILRYGSLYGPRSGKDNGIRKMIKSALNEGKIYCSGAGEEMREYIHVKDAATLSVKILDDRYCNKHIVLTGHDSYSKNEVINILSEILGKEIKPEYVDNNDELHYVVTPYTYRPAENYKLVSDFYHDFGQGLIECIVDMEREDDNK